MVSEIKGTGAGAPQSLDTTVRKVQAPSTTAAGATAGTHEVVTLTDLAARLQKLSEAVRDLPVVDQSRVAELRDQLASGNYQVDEQDVADKLAQFEAQLRRG